MVSTPETIDISSIPELDRLVEEVRATNQPRVLRRGDEDVAMLVPLRPRSRQPRRRATTVAEDEAFRSAAGGWAGIVDAEELKRQIMAARGSDRPVRTL